MEREGVSTLSIRGFPRALRYLLIFKLLSCVCVLLKSFEICLSAVFHFMVTLVSVLKGVIKDF